MGDRDRDRIDLARGRNSWGALVNVVATFRFHTVTMLHGVRKLAR